MPHIGVHRFAARHCKEGGADDRKADMEILMDEKLEGVERAHGDQHGRRFCDAVDAEHAYHQKPTQHHRSEDIADEARAPALDGKQPDQDDNRQRHDQRRQRGGIDFQPFDRAQYRDRRRDGAIAVKQCRANQADNQQLRAPGPRSGIPGGQQRQQRDDAAFAAVVGAQYQQSIFR